MKSHSGEQGGSGRARPHGRQRGGHSHSHRVSDTRHQHLQIQLTQGSSTASLAAEDLSLAMVMLT